MEVRRTKMKIQDVNVKEVDELKKRGGEEIKRDDEKLESRGSSLCSKHKSSE